MANVLFVVVNFFSEKRKPVNIRKGKREIKTSGEVMVSFLIGVSYKRKYVCIYGEQWKLDTYAM